jgi:hypothetical protein
LVSAVAVHVLDEATTGFLPFYNQTVMELRERLGFFPAPTFSFGVWLGGLVIAVVVGFAMTPVVRRGGRVVRAIAIVFGILMVANAMGHLLGSAYLGTTLPGMWSSPILFAAAAWMVFQGLKGQWSATR